VYLGQPRLFRSTDDTQAPDVGKVEQLHQFDINGNRTLKLAPQHTLDPIGQQTVQVGACTHAFVAYAWLLSEALLPESCQRGRSLMTQLNLTLLAQYKPNGNRRGFACQLFPPPFTFKDPVSDIAIVRAKAPNGRHILCQPYEDQGLANRLCTIANCMMLAAWWRCDLAIV
jgi:hypothetical protein